VGPHHQHRSRQALAPASSSPARIAASKHGLIGLTRVAALELAESGVTVNAVCPGFTDTDMVAESASKIQLSTGVGWLKRARRWPRRALWDA